MSVGDLSQYVVTGLLVGGVYALMSIGLALIFGVMRVVNFAQGDFMMLGMYVTYFLATGYGIDPLLGALLIIPPFFLLGLVIGLVQSLTLLVLPFLLQNVGVFIAFLLVLYLRPQGLFGQRLRAV